MAPDDNVIKSERERQKAQEERKEDRDVRQEKRDDRRDDRDEKQEARREGAQSKDPYSPERTEERAKKGEELMGARIATGEPGQKQPKHDDARLSASKTVEHLNEIVKDFESETYGPSDKREGQRNPIPPEDRDIPRGPQILAAANTASGAIGAARNAIELQLESDARLVRDPRYVRDQRVYALGVQGKLPLIEKSPVEARAQQPPDIAPKTAQEQLSQDLPRIQKLEDAPAGTPPEPSGVEPPPAPQTPQGGQSPQGATGATGTKPPTGRAP